MALKWSFRKPICLWRNGGILFVFTTGTNPGFPTMGDQDCDIADQPEAASQNNQQDMQWMIDIGTVKHRVGSTVIAGQFLLV